MATWLSLISTASSRPKRWFDPPPTRTAYFCAARSPGIVLRVQQTCARVPAIASAMPRAAEATPLRCDRKFNAVRSAVRMPRAGPLTVAIRSPGRSRVPSGRSTRISIAGSIRRNAVSA